MHKSKSGEREKGRTDIKVWLAVSEFSPSLWCPETPVLCLVNWWVWHTETVDKQRENRPEHLEIHYEYTQGDPKAEGSSSGEGAVGRRGNGSAAAKILREMERERKRMAK